MSYSCEKCKAPGANDYCAVCSKNLCPKCMALGHCGHVPARSGNKEDHGADDIILSGGNSATSQPTQTVNDSPSSDSGSGGSAVSGGCDGGGGGGD